jgi:hypothetical protein
MNRLILIIFAILPVFLQAIQEPANWDEMTFQEKIIWRGKNPDPRINYALLVDKLRVKDYVKDHVNVAHVYFATNQPQKISLKNLPSSFIMKPNNAAYRLLIVKDGMVIADKKRQGEFIPYPATDELLQQKAKEWLGKTFTPKKQKQYLLVKPMILIEELLEPISIELHFHCFYGEVKTMSYTADEVFSNVPGVSIYDRDWNLLPVTVPGYDKKTEAIEKPYFLDDLIVITEELTKGTDYVRVDYMICEETPYFCEFTFTPFCGKVDYEPKSFLDEMSSYWRYPKKGDL